MSTYQQTKRRQSLLDRLDTLSSVPMIRWLRIVRLFLWIAAGTMYAASLRHDTLLLLLAAIAVEIAIFRMQLIEALKSS